MQRQTMVTDDPNAGGSPEQAMMCKQLIDQFMDVREGKHAFVKCLVTIFAIVLLFAPIVEIVAEAQAIPDATRDAENYNATSWAIGGMLAIPTSLGACVLAPDLFLSVTSNDAGSVLCLGAIPAAVIIAARTSKVSPPTARLMGKSPEYVSVYVKTYTSLVKHKRQQYAIMGCAVGSLASAVLVGCAAGAVGNAVGDTDALADEATEGCCLGVSEFFNF